MRGIALPLTADQRVNRALYLAGEIPLSKLDDFVRKDPDEVLAISGYSDPDGDGEIFCPDLYYLLEKYNGGKDPTAPDPAIRWRKPGSTFVNRTVDCSGGNGWMGGHDRLQEQRMPKSIGYDGYYNTNSKMYDARGPQRCFKPRQVPERGDIIVCESKSRGHDVGHEGRMIGYRGVEWDPTKRECWALIDVVDCAGRKGRSNKRTTGVGWFNTNAMFLRETLLD